MSWLDNVIGLSIPAGGGALAVKWVVEAWRDDRAARRGDKAESGAIATLERSVKGLEDRIATLESDLRERDQLVDALQTELDQQRALRRKAEDDLDEERRLRRELERRVSSLESKT
jgi:chromosome segregation ATPase